MAHNQSVSVDETLDLLVSDSFSSRLWQRDSTLWPEPSPGGDPASQTLGWLDLPAGLLKLGRQFAGLSKQLRVDGFTDVVVLGMGGSSMTPLTLSGLFASTEDEHSSQMRLHALDTVDPAVIKSITNSLDLSRTLFFVSSKSGTTVEPLSLEAHFRFAMSSQMNPKEIRRNFVALSDPGTPLSERARAGEFGTWVSTPMDVGGRFSALSAFGMMPAAAVGIDIVRFAESAVQMANSCQSDSRDNPGLELAAFLAANALAGRDKVTVLTSSRYAAFGMWVDQLLAESTGKNGKGLIPITGEPLLKPEQYGRDRQFIVFDTGDLSSAAIDSTTALQTAGRPVLVLKPASHDGYEIAGEFFRWQFATAGASTIMDIYPFDQPDVESAKVKSRELLSNRTANIDDVPLAESLLRVSRETAPRYVAITAFLPESQGLTEAFSKLRGAISQKTGMATTFGYGPRYLHSTGQLYKGGPQSAIVLGFVSGKHDHLAVPGESYTFGELIEAQASGDFMVMSEGGQMVLPIKLGDDTVGELSTATQGIIG